MLSNEAYVRSSEYEGHPNLLMTIGDLHFRLDDIPKAKANYRNGYALAPIWQNEKLLAEFETKIAQIFARQNELDSAYFYANKANLFYEKTARPKVNDPLEILADIRSRQGATTEGITYYENLIPTLIKNEDTRRVAYLSQKLGKLHLDNKNYAEALKNFERSLAYNEKLDDPSLTDDYNMLAFLHAQQGNFKTAYAYEKKYSDKYQEMLNADKLQQINELQVKYDTEKQQRENEKLNYDLQLKEKENQIARADLTVRNYIIGGVAALFLVAGIIGILIYNRRKVVQTNQMLQLEQKLLKTQMNPHFISNALMSAQGYIYENKPKEASNYLTKIAKLTRLVLENSRKESISLEEEIATLENYLLVQQKRYENFDFTLSVSDQLDPNEVYLPPMLTQPFVENAIEHGIQNLPYRGILEIQFQATEQNKLNISIADNGLGMSKSSTKENHQSLSSTIVRERLNNLAAYYKQKLDFDITSNFTSPQYGEGTKVVLTLPLST